MNKSGLGKLVIAFGIVSAVFFFYAGFKVMIVNSSIKDSLSSSFGDDTASAYGQLSGAVGGSAAQEFAMGFAVLSLGIGLGAALLGSGNNEARPVYNPVNYQNGTANNTNSQVSAQTPMNTYNHVNVQNNNNSNLNNNPDVQEQISKDMSNLGL